MNGSAYVAHATVDAWHVVHARVGPPLLGKDHDAEMAGDAGE
jgi:hypothetical protein